MQNFRNMFANDDKDANSLQGIDVSGVYSRRVRDVDVIEIATNISSRSTYDSNLQRIYHQLKQLSDNQHIKMCTVCHKSTSCILLTQIQKEIHETMLRISDGFRKKVNKLRVPLDVTCSTRADTGMSTFSYNQSRDGSEVYSLPRDMQQLLMEAKSLHKCTDRLLRILEQSKKGMEMSLGACKADDGCVVAIGDSYRLLQQCGDPGEQESCEYLSAQELHVLTHILSRKAWMVYCQLREFST